MKWAQWDKTQSRDLLGLFICVHIALCTIVAHNIAQNRPDNFPPYPPDNHHCSDDVYLREGGGEYCHRAPATTFNSSKKWIQYIKWCANNFHTWYTHGQCNLHLTMYTPYSIHTILPVLQGNCRQQTLPAGFIPHAACHQPVAVPHIIITNKVKQCRTPRQIQWKFMSTCFSTTLSYILPTP